MTRWDNVDPIKLEHVKRGHPPWRAAPGLTECGRDASAYPVLDRDEFLAKIAEQGEQRAAMSTCMSCWHTVRQHSTWAISPQAVMSRECKQLFGMRPDALVDSELRAIALLIEAHRSEFDELLTCLSETIPLTDALKTMRVKKVRTKGRRL